MLGLGKEMREIGSVVEEVELEREEGTLAKKCGSSRSVFIEVAHSLPRDLPHSTRLKMMAFFATTISKIHHSQDTSLRQQCRPISSRARIDDIATWATFADMGRAGDTWVQCCRSSG